MKIHDYNEINHEINSINFLLGDDKSVENYSKDFTIGFIRGFWHTFCNKYICTLFVLLLIFKIIFIFCFQ